MAVDSLFADAVPRPKAERVEDALEIPGEALVTEPPLRNIFVASMEDFRIMVCGKVTDTDSDLDERREMPVRIQK